MIVTLITLLITIVFCLAYKQSYDEPGIFLPEGIILFYVTFLFGHGIVEYILYLLCKYSGGTYEILPVVICEITCTILTFAWFFIYSTVNKITERPYVTKSFNDYVREDLKEMSRMCGECNKEFNNYINDMLKFYE